MDEDVEFPLSLASSSQMASVPLQTFFESREDSTVMGDPLSGRPNATGYSSGAADSALRSSPSSEPRQLLPGVELNYLTVPRRGICEESLCAKCYGFEQSFLESPLPTDSVSASVANALRQSLCEGRLSCAKRLLRFAAEHRIPVALSWQGGDLLQLAISQRSSEHVNFVLETLSEKRATVRETAAIISKHFVQLLARFPQLLENALQKDKFCFECGKFEVPLALFQGEDECPIAMTSSELFDWEEQNSDRVKEFWTSQVEGLEKRLAGSSGVQVMAVSKFVCIENVVSGGMGNFLFALVLADSSVDVFKSEAFKTLVQWKWHAFCRGPFLTCAFLHLVSSMCFSVFAAQFGMSPKGGTNRNMTAARATIGISWFITWAYTFKGLRPRLRVFSCLSVTILFFYALGHEDHTVFTAILTSLECISFWVTMVYYLQPFRSTGHLVSMFRYVLWDIIPFMIVRILVSVGFGLAFFVLFSEQFTENDKQNFSSVLRSFESLFYAVIGSFDPEVIRSSTDDILSAWRSMLFCLFVFVSGIVLLSLLIAIIGDTYDKVKLKEEAELVKCRASIVGVMDGWNTMAENITRMGLRFLRLMHLYEMLARAMNFTLELLAEQSLEAHSAPWQGRIIATAQMTRSVTMKTEKESTRERAEIMEQLAKIQTALGFSQSQTVESGSQIQTLQQRMDKIEDTLSQILDRLK